MDLAFHHGQDAQAGDALHQTDVTTQRARVVIEKWMIVINVSNDTTILFTTPVSASPCPDQHSFSVWQSTGAIHPVTCVKLDRRLTSLPHID